MVKNSNIKLKPTPRQESIENTTNTEEEQEENAISLFEHVKSISQMKYDAELRREDSLIQQSSHMQTAFSFITAAVFMAVPILIEHRGTDLSLDFFLVSISSIIACLLVSLFTASMAQRRFLKTSFMNIPEIEKFVEDTYADTLKKSQQLKQWIQVVGDVQVGLDKINKRRVLYIRISMGSFFTSLTLIILWFIVGIIKIL